MKHVLTIVGASARAAAQSAVRAGFFVLSGDLFADADLDRIADAARVPDYPAGLAAIVGGEQTGPWMYTGALENHPALVDEMGRARPLWGNAGSVLRRVRDPRLVAEVLARRGIACPPLAFDATAIPRDGSWLCKPRRSAGGAQVSFWTEASPARRPHGYYFQQCLEGPSYSAVFVAAQGRAALLGVTRQLVGQTWTGAGAFRYCGSIGPVRLDAAAAAFRAIGNAVAEAFALQGLFGIDAIVNSSGVWPLEVNPRYTASVEILERGGLQAVSAHAAACEQGQLPAPRETTAKIISGKAIVFARQRITVPESWTARALAVQDAERPLVADIPPGGSIIEPGWPIATVFADADDEAQVLQILRRRANTLPSELPR